MDNQERIAELAQQAAQGSQGAFNELYRLTRDRAYFVAFTITKNEQDALDIVQDSYLKAWRHIGHLRPPWNFGAWIKQISCNTAKDFIKHLKPNIFEPTGETEENPLDLQAEKDSGYIPDAAMDTEETRRLIMDIVDGLPEDQRLCILMYYYNDMEMQEIAAALDIPLGTVQSRLHRAREKISRGVEDLEKKQGVKLYSAAPIPLLMWLLRRAAGETSAKLPPVILGGTAATAGGILAAITLPKIIAGIAAVVIIGGAVAGITAAKRAETTSTTIAEPVAANTFNTFNTSNTFNTINPINLVNPVNLINPSNSTNTVNITKTANTSNTSTSNTSTSNIIASNTSTSNTTIQTTALSSSATTTKYNYTVPSTAAGTAIRATQGSTAASTTTASTSTTTTTTKTTAPKPPFTGEVTTDRVFYQLAMKMYPEDFPQDDFWQPGHFKPGSSYTLMAAELMKEWEAVFPAIIDEGGGSRLNFSALEAAQNENRLVSWAQGIAAQGDQIYAKHLSQSGVSYWIKELKPKLTALANLLYYSDTFIDYTYDEWLQFQKDPNFPVMGELTLDSLIDYQTKLLAYFGMTDSIPAGDPTEP
ncbi:MAG: RNA polymerase sigma factor [Oscillospiraceae bacterium]|nr:RNA polymerase sigma factor [Oscillospiraceae bacterium]